MNEFVHFDALLNLKLEKEITTRSVSLIIIIIICNCRTYHTHTHTVYGQTQNKWERILCLVKIWIYGV